MHLCWLFLEKYRDLTLTYFSNRILKYIHIIIYYSSCLYILKLFKLRNSKFQFLVGHPKLYAETATSSWKILLLFQELYMFTAGVICQFRKCEGYARLHLCTGYSNSNTVGAGRLRPKFLLLYWLVGKRHNGQKQDLAHERCRCSYIYPSI